MTKWSLIGGWVDSHENDLVSGVGLGGDVKEKGSSRNEMGVGGNSTFFLSFYLLRRSKGREPVTS